MQWSCGPLQATNAASTKPQMFRMSLSEGFEIESMYGANPRAHTTKTWATILTVAGQVLTWIIVAIRESCADRTA